MKQFQATSQQMIENAVEFLRTTYKKTNKKNGTGVYALTYEDRSKMVEKVNSQRWMCLETGHISNPGALAKYQRARGIDTSKRKRIE